jgi:hypothetical protein
MMQDVRVKLKALLPLHRQQTIFTIKLGLNLRNKLAKCYTLSTNLYGGETLDTSESRSERI